MPEPFTTLTGIAVPFGMKNVDTDLIVPSRYLKTISRFGLGKGAFESLRERPDNIFDSERNRGAPILIAGDNFGCGSSREHAPWALADMGFKAIIAPSFADIFSGNAVKNGILLVTLAQEAVDRLLGVAETEELVIDLPKQTVSTRSGETFGFEIDPFRKHCLLSGQDEIALVEASADDIAAYESRLAKEREWVL